MGEKLLGVPLVFWSAGCLALSVMWAFLWPSDKVVAGDMPRFIILRWAHALVWMLLAIAAALWGFNLLGGTATARVVALLSLGVYLVFMFTILTAR